MKIQPVSYWRTATRRNSVRAMIAHFGVALVLGTWAALPGSYVDRLPVWVVWSISAIFAAIGLASAYTKQPSLEENNVDTQ